MAFLVSSILWKHLKKTLKILVQEQSSMHAVKSRIFTTLSSVQILRHTHTKGTDKTQPQYIIHTSHLKYFWWRLSEFSVNMHASWLKHLNFPLVPYHTVLQSACSSNRLIGPIISTNFDLTNRHKTICTYLIVGRIKCLPSLHTFHTLAYFLPSGVEMSRDINTSESKGWNGISHLDFGCLIIEHTITKAHQRVETSVENYISFTISLAMV